MGAAKKFDQELGLFPGISNEDYHASPGESSSSVKQAAKALKLYRAYKEGEIVSGETEATLFGTVVHSLILEPDLFDKQYSISPAGVKRPSVTQLTAKKPSDKTIELVDFWERFDEEHKGMTIVKQDVYDNACRVRDAVYTHPEAKELFFAGEAELSGYYLDQDFENGAGTNMLCRYRPDYRTDDYLLDLKTALDGSKQAFMRTIANFGYHVSAAHYLAGDRQIKSTNHDMFGFVVAEKTPPYMVSVYWLSKRDLELGQWIRRQALNSIKASRESKEWPGYNNDIAIETELPPYLFYDMDKSRI